MYKLFKTAYCMLKKRKMQSFLIGMMLLLTTMLFFTGVGIMTSGSPFEQMFERARASHTELETDKDLYDIKQLTSWWENNAAVENVNVYYSVTIPGPVKINGEYKNESYKLSEFIPDSGYDLLYASNNILIPQIREGEVWINTNTASSLNLKIGDTISLPSGKQQLIDFTVSNIIVDPIYSSGMSSSPRIWVSKGTIDRSFKDNKHIYQIGIRFKHYSEQIEANTLRDFKKSLPDGFLGTIFTYPSCKQMYTITSDILSALLVIIAVVMLLVVMMIIRSTINNVILNKYKSIGVMKAIGYSSHEIVQVFVLQFMLILGITMPFGLLLGHVIKLKLLKVMTSALNIPVRGNVVVPLLITFFTLCGCVLLFTAFSARKAGKVRPVQAIKYGMPESKHYKTNFQMTSYEKVPLTLLFVIKQILGNKKHSLFQILVFSTSVFLAIVILSISTSFNDKDTIMYYIGMASGDMAISPNEDYDYTTLISDLKNIKGVEALASYDYFDNCAVYASKPDDYIGLYGIIIQGDIEEIGIKTKEGHFPHNAKEILITQYLATQTQKTLGDYIDIESKYGVKTFLISGIYETVFNFGQEFIISSNFDESMPVKTSGLDLKLKLSKDYETIEKLIQDKYGTGLSLMKEDYATKSLKNSTQKVTSVLYYVSIIFLIVCGFAIFNWTLMEIKNASKMYGILKANGMNNSGIIKVLLVKTWFITLISCAVGITLSTLLASPLLLFFLAFGFQLSTFVINVPMDYALLITLLFIVISTIATLLPALKIGKITPRILIVE